MAKSKKTKPRDHRHRWSISLIKATPAKYLGQVFAKDEAEAIREAAKEFKVGRPCGIGLSQGGRTIRQGKLVSWTLIANQQR